MVRVGVTARKGGVKEVFPLSVAIGTTFIRERFFYKLATRVAPFV